MRQCGRHGDLAREVPGEVFGNVTPYARADTDTTGAFSKRVSRGVQVVREDAQLDEETNRRVRLWEGRAWV